MMRSRSSGVNESIQLINVRSTPSSLYVGSGSLSRFSSSSMGNAVLSCSIALSPIFCASSVDTLDCLLLHGAEGTHFADAIPGIPRPGFASNGLVPLQEARHEELFGKGCQLHTAPGAIVYGLLGVVGVDDSQDCAGLRGIIGDA